MRLDQFLVKHLGIESRNKAQDLILNKSVIHESKNIVLDKPSYSVDVKDYIHIKIINIEALKYVSRAGFKLESIIQHLNIDVNDLTVLDIGQSTGGFTDCVLQMGAKSVMGIDVGSGQLHEKIRNHPKVTCFENINAKQLNLNEKFIDQINIKKFDLIICDVSFISLKHIIPGLNFFLNNNGHYLFLVKSQFECGPEYLNKSGLVKNEQIFIKIEQEIKDLCLFEFGHFTAYEKCSILGKDGNQEFFIYG